MSAVADLELELDVFSGPFDLLLALVLRNELDLAEVAIAEIVVAYVERAHERGELDLESASEFLVLIAALLEIKVRRLLPGEELELEELSPEDAERELAERLLDYRRYQAAAAWLRRRLEDEPRVFRSGPAPLAPRPLPVVVAAGEDPRRLAACLRRLLVPPPPIDLARVRRSLVPVSVFVERLRVLLRDRRSLRFEDAVSGLDALGQASAFLAVLELVRRGEALAEQDAPFAPIRLQRADAATLIDQERAIA
jgi:segregation and condensation protein A